MSDTPRTDAVQHNIAELGVFARQLERELTDARQTIEFMRGENQAVRAAGQDAVDYIDGKHREYSRVIEGWRKANR